MKKILLYFFGIVLIYSCKNENSEKEIQIKFKPNEKVSAFKILEILNDKQIPKNGLQLVLSENLNPKTDTVKFNKDEIYISYLESLTGCVKYDGDIIVKNDSILLKLVEINNMSCPELEIGRVIYKIENKQNIKYKIGKYRK